MGKTAAELRTEIEEQRAHLSRDLEAIGDRVSPGRMVERRTSAVRERARNLRRTVMGTTHDMQARAGDAATHAREAAGEISSVPEVVKGRTEGNPLAAGLVAFGLGLLAATLIPSTERERAVGRKVQPQLEHAARRAGETGRHLSEELAPMAQEAGTHVREAASEAARRVGEHAQEAAGEIAGEARQGAEETRDAATGTGST